MLKTRVVLGISLMAVMAAAFGVTVLFAGDTNEPNKPSAVGLSADANKPSDSNKPSDANKVSTRILLGSDCNDPNKPKSTVTKGNAELNTPAAALMGTDGNEPNKGKVSSRVLTLQ
jgi:hypothetical protein